MNIRFIFFPQLLFNFFGIMVTAVASTPFALVLVMLVSVLFLPLRSFYLKTAREVKRLEAAGMCVMRPSLQLIVFTLFLFSTQPLVLPFVCYTTRTTHHSLLLHAIWCHAAILWLPQPAHSSMVPLLGRQKVWHCICIFVIASLCVRMFGVTLVLIAGYCTWLLPVMVQGGVVFGGA